MSLWGELFDSHTTKTAADRPDEIFFHHNSYAFFFCLQRGECDSSRAKIPSGGSKMPLYGCNLAKRHQLVEITTSSPSGLVALRRNGRLFFRFFWTVRNVCSTSPRDKSFGSTFPRQPGHPPKKPSLRSVPITAFQSVLGALRQNQFFDEIPL